MTADSTALDVGSRRTRPSDRRRAADYQRALSVLRERHREEFEAIYEAERSRRQEAGA